MGSLGSEWGDMTSQHRAKDYIMYSCLESNYIYVDTLKNINI